ncbi:hypothetical protein N9L24_03380, partial [Candidatus Marinamargulisbacteria bacterium]|nr:hypothetical protein [Candidatus Marinamargulisbacteria bacterium]
MKVCFVIISSRKKCILDCLQSLWEHVNHRYNYPVYVYYFDDIYDSWWFKRKVTKKQLGAVHFQQTPYQTPSFIEEHELFYHRKDLDYVRKSFSIKRKGYLHMCHFFCNMFNMHEELRRYDIIITHDDESGYTQCLNENPAKEIIRDQSVWLGAYSVGKRLKNGKPHQGHLDTRLKLWEFTK